MPCRRCRNGCQQILWTESRAWDTFSKQSISQHTMRSSQKRVHDAMGSARECHGGWVSVELVLLLPWAWEWKQRLASIMKQVMNATFLSLEGIPVDGETGVGRIDETDVDWYQGPCINSAKVWGLADTSDKETPRQGELVFKDDTEEPLTFNIVADHKYSISDGSYTLLGCKREKYDREEADGADRWIIFTSKMWVVGQQRLDRTFEKLSVVSVDGNLETFSQSGVKIVLCWYDSRLRFSLSYQYHSIPIFWLHATSSHHLVLLSLLTETVVAL